MNNNIKFAFFGTAPLAGAVLSALEERGFVPSLVVAGSDSVDSRTKTAVSPPEKSWAIERDIEVVQPSKIDPTFVEMLASQEWDVFVVASYGKILPKALLDIPRHGTLNMHPSLLPRLRGPSPIRSAILNDEKEVGVSVMILDEQMDHGPLLAQKKIATPYWPMRGLELDDLLAREGAALLAAYLPLWIAAEVEPRPQHHDLATYCTMFKKEDGLIDLAGDARRNLLKIRAFEGWPGTFSYFEKGGPSTSSGQTKKIRVKIVDAHIQNDALILDRVIPEGKREMSFAEFSRGL